MNAILDSQSGSEDKTIRRAYESITIGRWIYFRVPMTLFLNGTRE
jgi:hypothetical protein